jgi:hypothetical protein
LVVVSMKKIFAAIMQRLGFERCEGCECWTRNLSETEDMVLICRACWKACLEDDEAMYVKRWGW